MSTKKLMIVLSFVMLSQAFIVACAATGEKETKDSSEVYYSNCGVVNLQGADGMNMTKEERIAAEENTLFDALDENSECNKKALVTGQQAVTAAGAASAGGNAGDNSGSAGNNSGSAGNSGQQSADTSNPNSHTNQQHTEQVISSTSGVGGNKSGVNGQEITVCQISRENLAASTTPEDKTFWQSEVDKNCK